MNQIKGWQGIVSCQMKILLNRQDAKKAQGLALGGHVHRPLRKYGPRAQARSIKN
jgi:hypothetical protein